jgi:hypothetical protein
MFSPLLASAEVILIDLVALVLTLATVWALFYFLKKIFPDDFRQTQFLLTFVIVIVPCIMLIYIGVAVLNYDSAAEVFGWPRSLPLESSSLVLKGAVVFYIGLTAWLWARWRKLR